MRFLKFLTQSPDGLLHAAPVLAELAVEIARDTDIKNSAITALEGQATRVEEAVAEAMRLGATAEELAPVTASVAEMRDTSDRLATAVANTSGRPL